MLVLSELLDSIEIRASCQDKEKEVLDKLNSKYMYKMDSCLGLCIYVKDITEILEYEIKSEILIASLKFTVIFLRFYPDEVCYGRILGQDEDKIMVGNGLFNHYECQALDLFENCEFESENNTNKWIWNYKGNKLVFHLGEYVTFRIKNYRPEDSYVEIYMNEQGLGPRSWWQ